MEKIKKFLGIALLVAAPILIIILVIVALIIAMTQISASASGTSFDSGSGYWWPIGSAETTKEGDKIFASADPEIPHGTSVYRGGVSRGWSTLSHPKGAGEALDITNAGGGDNHYNIISMAKGVVTDMSDGIPNGTYGNTGGMGNYVIIKYTNNMYSGDMFVRYMHMYPGSITVKTGDTVDYGQVIGKMGNTGDSAGTHLHIDMVKDSGDLNGTFVDVSQYLDATDPRPAKSGGGSSGEISIDDKNYVILENAKEAYQIIQDGGFYQASNDAWGDHCLGFSYVYSHAVYTGDMSNLKNKYHDGNNDPTGYFSVGSEVQSSNKQTLVKQMFEMLKNNKPCSLQVVGSTNGSPDSPRSRHYVSLVGYKKGVTESTVKDTDLLILDTWDGQLKPVVAENTDGRYMLDAAKASNGYTYHYQYYKMLK